MYGTFSSVKVKDLNIILPEGYEKMFSDMESLKSFIIGRLAHEAERTIRDQVSKQMKDLELYRKK
jgi:hypothetical protein